MSLSKPPSPPPAAEADALMRLPPDLDRPAWILQQVARIGVQGVINPITGDVVNEDLGVIAKLFTTTNWHHVVNDQTATTIWAQRVCHSTLLLDYVMNITQRSVFALRGCGLYDVAIDLLTHTYSRPPVATVMDPGMVKRLGNETEYRALLHGNPWLVTLLLFNLSDGVRDLGRMLNRSNARSGGAAPRGG